MPQQLIEAAIYGAGGILSILVCIIGFFGKRLVDKIDSLVGLPEKVESLHHEVGRLGRQVEAFMELKEDVAYVRGRLNGSLDRNGEKKNGSS